MKRRTIQSPTGRTVIVEPCLQRLPLRTREAKELRRAFAPDRVFHDGEEPDYAGLELRLMATLAEKTEKP